MRPPYLPGAGSHGAAGSENLSCTPGDVPRCWVITTAGAIRQIRGRVLTVFTMNRRQNQVSTIMTTPF